MDREVPIAIDIRGSSCGAERSGALCRIARISRRSAVDFHFAVAPAAVVAEIELPYRGVGGASATVELLAPGRRVGLSTGSNGADAAATSRRCGCWSRRHRRRRRRWSWRRNCARGLSSHGDATDLGLIESADGELNYDLSAAVGGRAEVFLDTDILPAGCGKDIEVG